MNRRELFRILAIGCLLVFVASGAVFAAGKGKGNGTLTSLEEDGSVVVDGKGYLLSPSVIVQDSRGERLAVRNLSLPCYIYFEYEYTREGFMIILIKEMPI